MKISYTAKDFDSYFTALKTAATAAFPEWTDFNDSNIGVLFLELIAAVGDQNSFYLNRVINEVFLPTVQKRRNMIRILKRMNYTMAGRVAASVDLTFTIVGGAHTEDITIPKGYVVTTDDGEHTFETTAILTITAGNPNGVVSAKNQVDVTDNLVLDGASNQERYLSGEEYVDLSTVVVIASISWTRVTDFLDSGAADKHYKVEMDDELHAVLIFGDGVNGAKPSGTGTCNYKTGGGVAANGIQVATITKLTDTIYDALAAPMDMTVSNAASPSGGQDEESLDEAREQAPASIRTSDRTVSRTDYEENSEEVPGVARALALGRKEDASININTTHVWIVPDGGGAPSGALKTAVETYLEDTKPMVITAFVIILDGIYKNVTVAGTVLKNVKFTAAAVKVAVDAALTEFFDYENLDDDNEHTIDFGHNIPTSKLYLAAISNVIMETTIGGVKCVDDVSLTSPTGDVALTQKEIPALQTLAGLTVS